MGPSILPVSVAFPGVGVDEGRPPWVGSGRAGSWAWMRTSRWPCPGTAQVWAGTLSSTLSLCRLTRVLAWTGAVQRAAVQGWLCVMLDGTVQPGRVQGRPGSGPDGHNRQARVQGWPRSGPDMAHPAWWCPKLARVWAWLWTVQLGRVQTRPGSGPRWCLPTCMGASHCGHVQGRPQCGRTALVSVWVWMKAVHPGSGQAGVWVWAWMRTSLRLRAGPCGLVASRTGPTVGP